MGALGVPAQVGCACVWIHMQTCLHMWMDSSNVADAHAHGWGDGHADGGDEHMDGCACKVDVSRHEWKKRKNLSVNGHTDGHVQMEGWAVDGVYMQGHTQQRDVHKDERMGKQMDMHADGGDGCVDRCACKIDVSRHEWKKRRGLPVNGHMNGHVQMEGWACMQGWMWVGISKKRKKKCLPVNGACMHVMVASFISSSYRARLSYLITVLVLSFFFIYGCGLVSS